MARNASTPVMWIISHCMFKGLETFSNIQIVHLVIRSQYQFLDQTLKVVDVISDSKCWSGGWQVRVFLIKSGILCDIFQLFLVL